jgi:hypothetical protein
MRNPMTKASDVIVASMPALCRAAWERHEAGYAGGYGGGRCTAARAFLAGWQGRKAAALAIAWATATGLGKGGLLPPGRPVTMGPYQPAAACGPSHKLLTRPFRRPATGAEGPRSA